MLCSVYGWAYSKQQLRSLDSPTRSQAHCTKRPLPPGMASLWPLREEMPMLITHSGLSSLPCPSPKTWPLSPGDPPEPRDLK